MKNNFVIISYPRTGSTYLVKVLNTAKNLSCYSELFHSDFSAFSRSFLDEESIPFINTLFGKTNDLYRLYKFRNRNPLKFLNKIFRKGNNGFKIFTNQNEAVLIELLNDKNVKKIFLNRENVLRNYVSHRLAKTTGKWDRLNNEKPKLNTIIVDIEDFLDFESNNLNIFNTYKEILKKENQNWLDLTYEEITKSFPVKKIETFLGIDLSDITLEVNQKKQNPFSLKKLIENYIELKKALEDNKINHYLESQ